MTQIIEAVLSLLGVELWDGVQILSGEKLITMHHPPLNPDYPALVGKITNQQMASAVKRVLLNQYADDFEVRWVCDAGTAQAHVEYLPLAKMDNISRIDPGMLLFLPEVGEMSSFEQFQNIIAQLRAPDGCPWDRQQTHASLRKYLLEETYEVLEAIDRNDLQALAEELGDLMLQIVLHTQIATEAGDFRMIDVFKHINQKMVRRHPHVFSTVSVESADEVVTNWQAIKQQEKAENGKQAESLLDSVPKNVPALMLAYEYQARAAKVGFDWDEIGDVRKKINEEMDEALAAVTDAERADEIGDVLFVLVNWARWLSVEPENALRDTSAKFYRRFNYIERQVRATGKSMTAFTLAELDAFWDEAKAHGL